MKRKLLNILLLTIDIILAAFMCIMIFRYDFGFGDGRCMNPLIYTGDCIITDKQYDYDDIKVGDIVACTLDEHYFPAYDWLLFKLKGDVNSKNEMRIVKRVAEITDEGLYLLGDNSEHSYDSRYFGIVSKDDFVGKVVIVIPKGGPIWNYKRL